jgi:hypothetical protein
MTPFLRGVIFNCCRCVYLARQIGNNGLKRPLVPFTNQRSELINSIDSPSERPHLKLAASSPDDFLVVRCDDPSSGNLLYGK